MKSKVFLFAIYVFFSALAGYTQNPDLLNYQAVLRDAGGEIIANQSVEVQISIIDIEAGGDAIFTESHLVTTSDYGHVNLVIGTGSPIFGVFADIDWTINDKYIGVTVDAGSGLTDLGASQLLSVPYALHANSASNLSSNNIYIPEPDTLFAVKDNNGNVVFAVFPDGVKVIVEEASKGSIGGFAVSGRSPTKADETNIFIVTPDSTRIYVNDTVQSKGRIGGFAVSGRSPTKGINDQYMVVTIDSTRIFTKDAEGGFGVRDNSTGSSQSYLQLTPQNYFIGHESGVSITTGSYNSFMGYKSGLNTSTGDNNVFLGYQTGYSNTEGFNNVFIGYNSGYSNIDGYRNVFIGYEAGYDNTSGFLNTFIGNVAGTNSTDGAANTIIGNYAGYSNISGDENVFVGQSAGFGNESGSNNIYIGRATAYNNAGGSLNTYVGHFSGYSDNSSTFNVFIGAYSGYSVQTGTSNVFIGKYAGYNETSVSDKLIISNSQTKNLIEGDFANDKVTIKDILKLTPRSTAPSNPVEGEIYVNSSLHHIYCYLNGVWVRLDN
ncbi:MAG: hypothetical protein KOO66_01500 [Bacteroidales bacterium]|nr:hypothetical protein [Bacteroidales bacterium]